MGRKKEVEELQTWLANPNIKIIGIQGLGGIGKSSLAAYLYQNSSFAAKYWADVSQKPDFAAFAEKTIPALGGSVTQTGDTTQLINDLLKCLRQQRCLLVIDNLETLLNEAREFPDSAYQEFFISWLAKGETSTLLVTTQENPQELEYDNDWYRYPLEGMTPADGAELLQKQKIQGTVEELAAFAASMDGHPLTLELVAGYLRADDNYQLSGVEDLKLQQFDLVYRRAKGLHKNRTLKYVRLEWILQQHLQRLSEEKKNFLVNLSIYRQPFDVRAAEMMLTSPPTPLLQGEGSNSEVFSANDEGQVVDNSPTKDALWELYNRSLLLKTEDKRYKFQALVQEYLQKQGTDLSAAHEIAIDHYKSQVKPQPWETLEDVREYLEIFYHLCQLQRYGEAFYTIRDDDYSDGCVENFLDLRGYNTTLVELYSQVVDFQESKDDFQPWQFSAALTSLGNAYQHLGQYQEAIHFHLQSLEIHRKIGHRTGEGGSLCNIAIIYYYLGKYQKAINYYQEALAILKPISHRQFEANTLFNLGNVYESMGQYQKGISFHEQSIEIASEICDPSGKAIFLHNLGSVYYSLGEYQEAICFYQQSLEIARKINHRLCEGVSLNGLGIVYYSLGEYYEAIRLYQQSLEIAREINHRLCEGISLNCLGIVYYSLGEYQEAIRFHLQSLEIARKIGERHAEGSSLGNLGAAYYYLGEYQEAIRFHLQSLEIGREISDKSGEGGSLCNLGNVYVSLGEYQEAINYYQQALAILQPIGHREFEANSLMGLGYTYQLIQEYQQAINCYQQLLQIRRETNDRQSEANCLQTLSKLYYQTGRIKEGFASAQTAIQILTEIGTFPDDYPFPPSIQSIIKFAQRGKWQLALCFILGLFALPFALVLAVPLMLWRVVRAQFRRRS